MNVVVIEDEGPAARRLVKLIRDIDPEIDVLTVIESVRQGAEWFADNDRPDLVLSDIQLSDDLSFELFRRLNLDVPVIFTTAYDEYAIRAFEHNSVDYLLKPIVAAKLKESLSKFRERFTNSGAIDFEQLLSGLRQKDYRERFLVTSGYHLVPLPCDSVAFCYSADGRTQAIDHAGKSYALNETLDQLEEDLDPRRFFRANRQFIVSAQSVQRIEPHFNQKLKVEVMPKAPVEIFVSKLKATSFKSWIGR